MNKETIQQLANQLGICANQIEKNLSNFIPEYCKLFMDKSIVATVISIIIIIFCFVALGMAYSHYKKYPRSDGAEILLVIVAIACLVIAAFALMFLIIGVVNIAEINASQTAYFYSNIIRQ